MADETSEIVLSLQDLREVTRYAACNCSSSVLASVANAEGARRSTGLMAIVHRPAAQAAAAAHAAELASPPPASIAATSARALA